jgi:hypothetical protein
MRYVIVAIFTLFLILAFRQASVFAMILSLVGFCILFVLAEGIEDEDF